MLNELAPRCDFARAAADTILRLKHLAAKGMHLVRDRPLVEFQASQASLAVNFVVLVLAGHPSAEAEETVRSVFLRRKPEREEEVRAKNLRPLELPCAIVEAAEARSLGASKRPVETPTTRGPLCFADARIVSSTR